jgi:hypothetical protein
MAVSRPHFLESFVGSLLLVACIIPIGAVLVYTFTDLQFGDMDACYNRGGYPKMSEIGLSVGLTAIASNVANNMQHQKAYHVFNYLIEFWMLLANSIIMMCVHFMMLLVTKITPMAIMRENITSFVIIITINITLICGLPMYYYYFYYNKRSQVTDVTRSKFSIAEKQPFAMEQLIEFAGKELETDSILLYLLVTAIIKLRSNHLDSEFQNCEKLATVMFEKYIQGSVKTLTWYDMHHIVSEITSPIQLLEKEAVLKQLQETTRERIVLPMFARMLTSQANSIALVK